MGRKADPNQIPYPHYRNGSLSPSEYHAIYIAAFMAIKRYGFTARLSCMPVISTSEYLMGKKVESQQTVFSIMYLCSSPFIKVLKKRVLVILPKPFISDQCRITLTLKSDEVLQVFHFRAIKHLVTNFDYQSTRMDGSRESNSLAPTFSRTLF